jgi:hypothetical protein
MGKGAEYKVPAERKAKSPVAKTPLMIRNGEDQVNDLPFRWSEIDQMKWQTVYGTKRTGGQTHQLCWYFCNRPKGCSNLRCEKHHELYPDAYNDKPLLRLSSTLQAEILRRCPRA